jgi:hypothetical protein
MSRVYRPANPDHVFSSRQEIEEHLLSKTQGNTGGRIGTELELFVTTPEGLPITFDQVEMLLEHMQAQFPQSRAATEKGRVVALNIPDIGDVSLEPGGQIELSTKPCDSLEDLERMNKVLRAALDGAAAHLDLAVRGQGHLPSFIAAGDVPRSRFAAYCGYLRGVHGAKAEDLIETMKSCCGLQVNFDPMGNEFHEIYRALMLVDVAQSLSARTPRQERLHETYARLVPEQHTPVFEALDAHTNEEVIGRVVDRLLTLRVPFIPDHGSPEGFTAAAAVFGHTPTVGELLAGGALTTEILDNSLSLQLTMPNLRRHGVLETRAPDSLQTPGELMEVAAAYRRFAYDAKARRGLLEEFSGIDPERLKAVFLSRFDVAEIRGLDIGGGKTAGDLVAAVIQTQAVPAPAAKTLQRPAP